MGAVLEVLLAEMALQVEAALDLAVVMLVTAGSKANAAVVKAALVAWEVKEVARGSDMPEGGTHLRGGARMSKALHSAGCNSGGSVSRWNSLPHPARSYM